MPQAVMGTFFRPLGSSGNSPGQVSDVLGVPSGLSAIKLTVTGLDASNTIKTQRSTNNGLTWVDQTTYNSNQNGTSIGATPGHQWRLAHVTFNVAGKEISYKLSAES